MTDTAEAAARSPGELFIKCWEDAVKLLPNERAIAPAVAPEIVIAVQNAIAKHSGLRAAELLDSILCGNRSAADRIAVVLTVMKAIDTAFLSVHPRSLVAAGHSGARQEWLSDAQELRIATGAFSIFRGRRLIARGPLTRQARQVDSSSADSLADRFAALSVVDGYTTQAERSIAISHRVVPASALHGVPPGKCMGSEQVAFLSVAQRADEMSVRSVEAGTRDFIDFSAATTLDVRTRIIDGLHVVQGADICIAPELIVSEANADEVCSVLCKAPASVRLIVLGSGHTREKDATGMHWNEARVVNGLGGELWRQRKLWPASISAENAGKLLNKDCRDKLNYFEYNAAGEVLEVVDIDGLGRCLVLICQDLQATPVTPQIIDQFQPDWVFVPILDVNVDVGRWAHQRIISYSVSSHSRYLLSTDLAYSQKLRETPPRTIGFAAGSLNEGRVCAPLPPIQNGNTFYASIRWGSDSSNWRPWTISA